MDYTNIQVALTVLIRGAQASRGSYEFKQNGFAFEKKENGDIVKFPVGVFITKKQQRFHECSIRTVLNSDFVNWAISSKSRPEREVSDRYWKTLSKKNRLKYHIEKYVIDLYDDAAFEYEILD